MVEACHAAIYVAATAGGALAPLGAPAAVARQLAYGAWIAHQRLRDDLITAIEARGASAPPALPAYRIPAAPITVTTALQLLAQVEDTCAAAAHDATAVLTADTRRLAVDALGGMAIRAQRARLAAGLPPATATRALPGT
ncbi:ferritin-like domain-containing protein [Frankia sp. AgB32]|nr:ferritin-like domain-containing protein [Frankia sp. AgB32]